MKGVGNAAYFNISDYSSIREDGMNPSHYLNKKNRTSSLYCNKSDTEML